jgi:1-acyl-sn-glycerol-3-phosphate acyltransferase
VGTGISFALFGVGAVVLGFTLWPLLRLTSFDRRRAEDRIQRAVSFAFRFFIEFMRVVGVITYEIHGREKLKRGQFVVANHPTLIDVVFLVGLMPEVDCIVKQALWRNVFLRWPVYWAGYISNATGEGLVAACSSALREGRSLLVFPEGTRTPPGARISMQRGAAQIALAAQKDLTPITITCVPIMLFKGNPWYRVPQSGPGHYILNIGETFPIAPFLAEDVPGPIAARHLTAALERYFETGVNAQTARFATENTHVELTDGDDSL